MSENTVSRESYSFEFSGGKNNSFIFRTDFGLQYEIKFVPSGYIFPEGHPAQDYTYEFVIGVLENNTGKNPPLDKKIPQTIALIFKEFFQEHRNVGVYICDSSDNKQAFRFRKFNTWFHFFKGLTYHKIDSSFKDKDDVVIYTSLIMRTDNPNYQAVIDGYFYITQEAGQDK